MNRKIVGVVAGAAIIAGLAAVSTTVAGVAVADGARITQQGDGREWSSEDSSIFTVNYGFRSADGREFSERDQDARDQGIFGQLSDSSAAAATDW